MVYNLYIGWKNSYKKDPQASFKDFYEILLRGIEYPNINNKVILIKI